MVSTPQKIVISMSYPKSQLESEPSHFYQIFYTGKQRWTPLTSSPTPCPGHILRVTSWSFENRRSLTPTPGKVNAINLHWDERGNPFMAFYGDIRDGLLRSFFGLPKWSWPNLSGRIWVIHSWLFPTRFVATSSMAACRCYHQVVGEVVSLILYIIMYIYICIYI